MSTSGLLNHPQRVADGDKFAWIVNTAQSSTAPGEMHVVKESQRRVEMKQSLDGKKGHSKRQRAPRKKGTAIVPPPPVEAPKKEEPQEELVADHELEILLDSFEADHHISASAPSGPIEPSSHGEDPAATEELWRRLSNTAWLRNPETAPDDGNSSTVAHRP